MIILFRNITALITIVLLLISCQSEDMGTPLEDHFYIRNGKSDMPVWVHGNKTSKVFIVTMHGGPGLGYGLDFRRGAYSKTLEDKYAMVYWDQRHQGSSHGHLKRSDISVNHIIDDIHFLLLTLKKKYGNDIKLFLMGHSWGGTISTAFMITNNNQDMLQGWINIAGTSNLPKQPIKATEYIITVAKEELTKGNSTKEWQDIIDNLSTIDLTKDSVSFKERTKIGRQENKASNLLEDYVNAPSYRQNGFHSHLFSPAPSFTILSNTISLVVSPFWDEVQNLQLTDQLHNITIPTLLQFGNYDLGTPPTVGAVIYNKINATNKYFKVYEKSAHEPFLNEPEAFTKDIITFIETYK